MFWFESVPVVGVGPMSSSWSWPPHDLRFCRGIKQWHNIPWVKVCGVCERKRLLYGIQFMLWFGEFSLFLFIVFICLFKASDSKVFFIFFMMNNATKTELLGNHGNGTNKSHCQMNSKFGISGKLQSCLFFVSFIWMSQIPSVQHFLCVCTLSGDVSNCCGLILADTRRDVG